MTILVIAELKTTETRRAALLDMVQSLADNSRQEDGCLSYRPLLDADHPGTIVIAEKWTSLEALQAHGRTAHVALFKSKVKDVLISIEKFHI